MPRDDADRSGALGHQPRAVGDARVGAALREGSSCLSQLRQSGSAKVLLPGEAGVGLTAILLNTAGGITGGDRFAYRGIAEKGSALTVSTQAAERAYRAQAGETGMLNVMLNAHPGARIDWLPQETILFDGARLNRRLDIDLDISARFLGVEAVILGRPAMGERLTDFTFTDQWRVRQNGHLIYADALRLGPDALHGPATLNGAGAFASVLLIASDAETYLAPIRALLGPKGGASLIRTGILAIRLLASDGFTLRQQLIPALEALRATPLPKVWRL